MKRPAGSINPDVMRMNADGDKQLSLAEKLAQDDKPATLIHDVEVDSWVPVWAQLVYLWIVRWIRG